MFRKVPKLNKFSEKLNHQITFYFIFCQMFYLSYATLVSNLYIVDAHRREMKESRIPFKLIELDGHLFLRHSDNVTISDRTQIYFCT